MGVAMAQTSGEISGEVKDPSGAVLLNAQVTVTNTTTNASGEYGFPNLVPGVYFESCWAAQRAPAQSLGRKRFGGLGIPVKG
jgi:Carboxypeptidase regulatory-like domain